MGRMRCENLAKPVRSPEAKPGKHTLELRVVTSDHNVELDATDKVMFVVK